MATTPSTASKADWSALFERPVVSEVCSAAMLLPCAATCPSVVARAAAVARGAIAGASALLSSFEASSAVTRSSSGATSCPGQVNLRARVVVPKSHERSHEFREGACDGDVVLRHARRHRGLLRVHRGVAEHEGPSFLRGARG